MSAAGGKSRQLTARTYRETDLRAARLVVWRCAGSPP